MSFPTLIENAAQQRPRRPRLCKAACCQCDASQCSSTFMAPHVQGFRAVRDRCGGVCLQDDVSQVRREASAAASELLEPGIDVIVAKLQEAEAQTAGLQQQLRQAEAASAGAAGSGAPAQLRAEVEHLKAVNGKLRAENRGLQSDMHVRFHDVHKAEVRTCVIIVPLQ